MVQSASALFVTAAVPVSIVNEALTLGNCGEFRPQLCLIENPEQESLRPDRPPPIPEFDTGFAGASIETLATYLERRFEEKGERNVLFSYREFAVIDERTLEDRTILYFRHFEELPADAEQLEPIPAHYSTVRIRLEDLPSGAIFSAHMHEFLFFDSPFAKDLVDENGVWHSTTQR